MNIDKDKLKELNKNLKNICETKGVELYNRKDVEKNIKNILEKQKESSND